MKEFLKKYREIIVYLVFGVITTVVNWVVYFGIIWGAKTIFGYHDESLALYWYRMIAQVVAWVAGVLVAFFTNKKYVFLDNNNEARYVVRKLIEFSTSRLATLLLDTVVTFSTLAILGFVGYKTFTVAIGPLGLDVSADLISKLLASILVVIGNYVLSKLFVFKKTDDAEQK